ncbi:MAG: transporter [Firmicutes bacterium]|nr:transporter [Bacillota bacterium]
MTSTDVVKPASNYRWSALALCCGMITICYIDRVNLAVTAPTLMKTFSLSTTEMGIMMSAFFWSYVLVMMPTGWLLNHYGPKKLGFFCCLGWGLATMAIVFTQGFKSLLAMRIVLGITESPAYPVSARVVSVWIPSRERTFSSAAFDSCSRVGNAIAPPLVVWLMTQWNWEVSFVISGALAVMYAFVWKFNYYEPDDHPKVSQSELNYIRQEEVLTEDGKVEKPKIIPLFQLFTYRRMVLVCIGAFCYSYYWTNFNMWVPSYLVQAKGFNLKTMGMAAMAPYIAGVGMEVLGGYLMDVWHRHGASINTLRRTGLGVCLLGAGATLFMAVNSDSQNMVIVWMTASMGIFSFGAGNKWSIPSDIAPYGQGGGIASVMNMVGNIGSIIAPALTGYLASGPLGYNGGFIAMAAIAGIGALVYMVNDYSRLVPR